VSESYDWWSLLIAVPKTAEMQRLLAPFEDAHGGDDMGLDVYDYGPRLAVEVSCMVDYGGPAFDDHGEDTLEGLADLLVKVRAEILEGDVSFLQAVAHFYGADEGDEDEEEGDDEEAPSAPARLPAGLSKADLQRECAAR